MPDTFTKADVVDRGNEKDWAYKLALMDWDTTKIVFTKRSLLEFLKYSGITVDTNLTNIQKLPRFAEFGTLTDNGESGSIQGTGSANQSPTSSPSAPLNTSAGFKPTRRVRDPPGGNSVLANIWGANADDEDALSAAPPRPVVVEASGASEQATSQQVESPAPAAQDRGNVFRADASGEPFKPTRRVRDQPGGEDSIKNLWS